MLRRSTKREHRCHGRSSGTPIERATPEARETTIGQGFTSPNQPDQERTTACRDSSGPKPRSDAKAHAWVRQLISGEASNIAEIARREGTSRPHASRLINLAFLAPGIVEAILEGRQPPEVNTPRRISGAKCGSPAGGSLLGALFASHDGVRLSSSYGMRRHPIRGYSAMHRGVDFAAPDGTPVYAASDGFVVEKDRKYGYGNSIRLRHDARIETIYAHLSRFALGIQEGIQVKQGEVIGYVGSTGQAAGPHLHYEVLFDGIQVDPNGVSLPPCAKSAKTLAY